MAWSKALGRDQGMSQELHHNQPTLTAGCSHAPQQAPLKIHP